MNSYLVGLIIIIVQCLFISHVSAEESCSEVEISHENLLVLAIDPSQIINREGKLYAVICFSSITTPIDHGRVTGAGCGGSSKCGGNFLVLDNLILPIGDHYSGGSDITVWQKFSLNTINDKRISIAKNVDMARELISKRVEGETMLMAPQLDVGINSALQKEFTTSKIRIGKNISPDTLRRLNDADGLKLILNNIEGANLLNIESLPSSTQRH